MMPAKDSAVPIQDINDEDLLKRAKMLSLNIYRRDGLLAIPSDIAPLVKGYIDECIRRNLEIDFHSHLDLKDPDPIFHSGSLIRYGKRAHLEAMMAGCISFAPASTYKDCNLRAQFDDEMKRIERHPNQMVKIDGVEYPASDIIISHHIPWENSYHILCLSMMESSSLGREFNADGFIKINDVPVFNEIISKALIGAGFQRVICKPVDYYDDCKSFELKTDIDYMFSKTIDYKYQREYRVAALASERIENRVDVNTVIPPGLFDLQWFKI